MPAPLYAVAAVVYTLAALLVYALCRIAASHDAAMEAYARGAGLAKE
ncbi:MAG: hypothetical protein JWO59_762 [Chloroflexi bacterium]|nr:hypothetical protein [Chloroflexota bacterium]